MDSILEKRMPLSLKGADGKEERKILQIRNIRYSPVGIPDNTGRSHEKKFLPRKLNLRQNSAGKRRYGKKKIPNLFRSKNFLICRLLRTGKNPVFALGHSLPCSFSVVWSGIFWTRARIRKRCDPTSCSGKVCRD